MNFNAVSETLLIPLYYRALESMRAERGKRVILHDKYAQDLVARIPYDYAKFDKAKMSKIGCIVRARYFDECVKRFIESHKNAVVINAGCGLDTRYERLREWSESKGIANFESARFFELDLPEVMEKRKELLQECAQDRFLACSLLDSSWVEAMQKELETLTPKQSLKSAPCIIVIEGVLMYFSVQEILGIFTQIAKNTTHAQVWCDFVGSMFVRKKSIHDVLKDMRANIKSGFDSTSEVLNLARQSGAEVELIESSLYFRHFPTRWGLFGMLMSLAPRFIHEKFSFMCGLRLFH